MKTQSSIHGLVLHTHIKKTESTHVQLQEAALQPGVLALYDQNQKSQQNQAMIALSAFGQAVQKHATAVLSASGSHWDKSEAHPNWRRASTAYAIRTLTRHLLATKQSVVPLCDLSI